MKTIDTLIPDIYSLVGNNTGWFHDNLAQSLSKDIAGRLQSHLGEYTQRSTLRLSQMGPRCPCAIWHSVHRPEMASPYKPWEIIKFSFGHVLEALVIALAKGARHEVTGEQDELILDGIVGHRDCVIDGYTVDVKSASSLSFAKIKADTFDDLFGYLDQLGSYVLAAKDDPLVLHKRTGYILAIDKQLGHLCLHKLEVDDERERTLRARVSTNKSTVALRNPPPCECNTIPHGASGNIQLDIKASYSPYKHCCFPGLRTFLYAHGPVFLTRVTRRPDVPEVDKDGRIVYH